MVGLLVGWCWIALRRDCAGDISCTLLILRDASTPRALTAIPMYSYRTIFQCIHRISHLVFETFFADPLNPDPHSRLRPPLGKFVFITTPLPRGCQPFLYPSPIALFPRYRWVVSGVSRYKSRQKNYYGVSK